MKSRFWKKVSSAPKDGTFVLVRLFVGTEVKVFAAGFDQETGMWMRKGDVKYPYIRGTPHGWMEIASYAKSIKRKTKRNGQETKQKIKQKKHQKKPKKEKHIVNTKAFWQSQTFGPASPVRKIDPLTMLPVDDDHNI
jgi:hypothetical protein